MEALIPYRALAVLDSAKRVAVANKIRNRYFSNATDLNKGDILVDLYTDTGYGFPSIQVPYPFYSQVALDLFFNLCLVVISQ